MNPALEATATFFPSLLRPLMRKLPDELTDRTTGLYNRAGLMAAANRAVGDGSSSSTFAVVVLEFTDLREVCEIYGNAVGRKVIARVVRRMRSIAGWNGLVGRTGRAQFTAVLPRATEDKALRQVHRALGTPPRVEFDAGDSEIVVVPDLLIDTAHCGTPVQDVYRDASRELARRQDGEKRRLSWLASERQRHSRPMALPSR